MVLRKVSQIKILDGANTTGSSNKSARIEGYKEKEVELSTSGMGVGDTLKVKVKISSQETLPNWDDSQDIDNKWVYAELIDLEDGKPLSEISFSASDDTRIVGINSLVAKWATLEITEISDAVNTSIDGYINLYD